jgi:nitrate/nitrite transport system permease protein
MSVSDVLKRNRVMDIPLVSGLLEAMATPKGNRYVNQMVRSVAVPLLAIGVFLSMWSLAAANVTTSLGQLPGPVQVWHQAEQLVKEHQRERAREAAFYQRQEKRNEAKLQRDPNAKVVIRPYTGKPTFFDQILTSLLTVGSGFLVASLIAIPVGILCGMSTTLYTALNPIIQVFKPVSPLAWLPIVTILVSALYVSKDPMFDKSYLTSAITVTLCCIWPTIINTTVGVSNVNKDLLNVSRVLRLSWFKQAFKIILPSSTPMIFAGLRLSLGIGWMVLIAAEMLAQNPGLGKFVWDEFQNGSSNSLARIMVAVLVIGIIGFMLDRSMLLLQKRVTWDRSAVLR